MTFLKKVMIFASPACICDISNIIHTFYIVHIPSTLSMLPLLQETQFSVSHSIHLLKSSHEVFVYNSIIIWYTY